MTKVIWQCSHRITSNILFFGRPTVFTSNRTLIRLEHRLTDSRQAARLSVAIVRIRCGLKWTCVAFCRLTWRIVWRTLESCSFGCSYHSTSQFSAFSGLTLSMERASQWKRSTAILRGRFWTLQTSWLTFCYHWQRWSSVIPELSTHWNARYRHFTLNVGFKVFKPKNLFRVTRGLISVLSRFS